MPACARCMIGSTRAGDSPDPPRHVCVCCSCWPSWPRRSPRCCPPPAATTPAPRGGHETTTVRGAYHVHSVASDGTGSIDEIAAAAARAGLQFRHPHRSRRRHARAGTAALSIGRAVHRGRRGEHERRAPRRARRAALALSAGGRAEAVLEDVHRLAAWASPRTPDRRARRCGGRDWTAPIDGLEWLNADSEWRDEFLGVARPATADLCAAARARRLTATLDRPTAGARQVGRAHGVREGWSDWPAPMRTRASDSGSRPSPTRKAGT